MTKAGMQIHPIRTEQDYRAAVARIEKLMSAAPDSPEGDELDVLATLVDAYEAKHHGMDAPDPVAAIQFRLEQLNLSRKDLEPMIGSRARVSEILTGKRSLTLEMVRRVRGGLGISADLLIASSPVAGRKRIRLDKAGSQGSALKAGSGRKDRSASA
jgi:HTH-type transcriptional regulator/antitoxin HigA